MTNTGSDVQSASLELLNPQSGLAVNIPPPNPVVIAPGETKAVPIVINAGELPTGVYDGIQLKVTGTDGSPIYSNFKVYIVPPGTANLPDLTLASKDIRLTANNPDSTVELTADIHNQGLSAASNVTVRFYEFDNVIGETSIAEVPSGGVKSTSITVPMAGSGDYLIRVEIDPLDMIQELDETNNEACQIVQPSGSPGVTEGHILVTGSLPSKVYSGSLFSISGSAVYDLLVNGIRNTDYVVKGGAVQVTIIGNGGVEWVYGDVHTDINGNFMRYLQAPTTPGTYRIMLAVTDNTFLGKRELVFTVIDPPPPGNPPSPPNPPAAWGGSGTWTFSSGSGGSGGQGGADGTWTWAWTTPPSGGQPPQSDLWVFSEDIHFSKNNPAPGDEITVFAEIHYWAASTSLLAQNVPVNLYAIYPGTPKVKIGQTTIKSISVGAPNFGSRYVFATWKNEGQGIYLIEAEIDPSYQEPYMLNNAATRAIIVGQISSSQGAVAGQVTDALGGVGGVTINVFDSTGTALLGSTLTDSTGYYLYEDVPIGAARVVINAPAGYAPDAVMKTTTVSNQAVAIVNFFLSRAAVLHINLSPPSATNDMGLKDFSHTVTALVADSQNSPQTSIPVTFTVSGVNAGVAGTCNPVNCITNSNGQIAFTYANATHIKGSDTITASFTNNAGQVITSQPVSKAWIMKCDLDNNGKIDRNDVNIILGGRGLHLPGDSRDIDSDGWVTVNDARACVLQCTNPNCVP